MSKSIDDRKQTRSRPSFQPLDDIDQRVEEVARLKGIPTLAPSAPFSTVMEVAPVPPSAQAVPGRRRLSEWRKFRCPEYLYDQLLAQAAQRRATIHYLVLEALSKAGYRVRDEDLVPDARRGREKSVR